jgi:periplasmic protein TonB
MKNAGLIAVLLLSGLLCASGMQSAVPSPTPTPTQESPKQPKRIRISSGVANSMLRHNVEPVYPSEARARHITGDVLLRILIDTSGNVTDVRVEKGQPILVDAAVEAVKQWKYRPYVLNGEPVEADAPIKIRFQM